MWVGWVPFLRCGKRKNRGRESLKERKRRRQFLLDECCFPTIHGTFTFLIHHLAKCLYVYLNIQKHRNLTCNETLTNSGVEEVASVNY